MQLSCGLSCDQVLPRSIECAPRSLAAPTRPVLANSIFSKSIFQQKPAETLESHCDSKTVPDSNQIWAGSIQQQLYWEFSPSRFMSTSSKQPSLSLIRVKMIESFIDRYC